MDYKTGTLVDFRNRPWVVLQSSDPNIVLLKPLGGTDAESIGLYLPLYGDDFSLKSYHFQPPKSGDLEEDGKVRLIFFMMPADCRSVTWRNHSNAWGGFLLNRILIR